MRIKGALALSIGGALMLASSYGAAQPVAQKAYTKTDVAAFSGGPDVLPDVINSIQSSTGGKVTEVRFVDKNGVPGFDAAVAKGGSVTFMRADAPAKNVTVLATDTLPDWLLGWRSRQDVNLAERAKYPLADAVRTAEKANGGAPAVAAGIAASASNPTSDVNAYNVLLKTGNDVKRVAVDSSTDQIIANPQALSAWP